MIVSEMNRLNITVTFDVLWQKQVCHEKGKKQEISYKCDLHSNYCYGSGYLSLSSYSTVFLLNILKIKIFTLKYFMLNSMSEMVFCKNISNKTAQTFPGERQGKMCFEYLINEH